MLLSLQAGPGKVGGVGVSAGQVPHTSSAAFDTPAWYTQSLQSFYPTTSSTGSTHSEFDFSGLMDFVTETGPTLINTSSPNHNTAFDFTFPITTFPAPGPPMIAPSSTVTPGVVMAAPQGLPTPMETNEQPLQPSTTKKTRKRRNPEDDNANCILPEGSRRKRKPRRLSD